jgi:uncharacterized membrane protein YuzA (DUF378 family)
MFTFLSMQSNKTVHMITFILLVIGGLNWLLYAVAGWEVGALLGGMDSTLAKAIYVLVGLSAIYEVLTHKSGCKHCGSGSGM